MIVGQDTDGLTNPLEIGAEWALRMSKPFFIGQRSLQSPSAPRRSASNSLVSRYLRGARGQRNVIS